MPCWKKILPVFLPTAECSPASNMTKLQQPDSLPMTTPLPGMAHHNSQGASLLSLTCKFRAEGSWYKQTLLWMSIHVQLYIPHRFIIAQNETPRTSYGRKPSHIRSSLRVMLNAVLFRKYPISILNAIFLTRIHLTQIVFKGSANIRRTTLESPNSADTGRKPQTRAPSTKQTNPLNPKP